MNGKENTRRKHICLHTYTSGVELITNGTKFVLQEQCREIGLLIRLCGMYV